MEDLIVCIYLAKFKDWYRVAVTHNIALDTACFLETEPEVLITQLSPYLPIGVADYVLRTVFAREELRGCALERSNGGGFISSLLGIKDSYNSLVNDRVGKVHRVLSRMEQAFGQGVLIPGGKVIPKGLVFSKDMRNQTKNHFTEAEYRVVLECLRGRIIFLEELQSGLFENGYNVNHNLQDITHVLALRGEIEVFPSLGFSAPGEVTCHRCGNSWALQLTPGVFCPLCKFPEVYCENCNTLGESKICRGLFALAGNPPTELSDKGKKPGNEIVLRGVPPLSPAQDRASMELVDFVKGGRESSCLLWAVAGAGKTEVVLKAIASVLGAGGKVLYAVPRRDVVQELSPRLQSSLADFNAVIVYGGSPEKFRNSSLVIATTHQVVRFYRQYDLVVLDEVDAYPYRDNRMLHMAVERAVKTNGRIVYLTATPDEKIFSDTRRGLSKLISIPARYHGYPVPEPELKKISSFRPQRQRPQKIDYRVLELIRSWLITDDRQIFIFLPTVSMVEKFYSLLEKYFEGWNGLAVTRLIEFSHARDPLRDQKRLDFKQCKFRVFITTTIMERGITVKNASVLVLEADYERVFDEGTLIQMAGRAGRSMEYPEGEVVFAGGKINNAMKSAREKIRYLNGVARREGYLK